jgi:hypothetical protein
MPTAGVCRTHRLSHKCTADHDARVAAPGRRSPRVQRQIRALRGTRGGCTRIFASLTIESARTRRPDWLQEIALADPSPAAPRTKARSLHLVVAPVGDVAGEEFGSLLPPLGLGVELLEGELAE